MNWWTMPWGTTDWLKSTKFAFYAWHWYFGPPDRQTAVENAKAYQQEWNMPSLLTEHDNIEVGHLATAAGIGQLFWSYSGYCNTAPDSRCPSMPKDQSTCRNAESATPCR